MNDDERGGFHAAEQIPIVDHDVRASPAAHES